MAVSLAALRGTEAIQQLRLFRFSLLDLRHSEQKDKWAPDCLVALGCSNFRDCYQLSSILGAAQSLADRLSVPQSPGVIVIGDCRLDCCCSSHLDPLAKKEVCFRHSLLRHFAGISSLAPTASEPTDNRNWRPLLEQLISVQPMGCPQLIVLNGVFPAMLREVLQVIQSVWSVHQPACKILLTSMFNESAVGNFDPKLFSAVSRSPSVPNWTCETEYAETVIETFRLGEIQLCKDMILSRTKSQQRSCLPLAFLRHSLCWDFDGFGFDSDFDKAFLELFFRGVFKPVDFVVDNGKFDCFARCSFILPACAKFTMDTFEGFFEKPVLKRNRFLNLLYIFTFDQISHQVKAILHSLSLELESSRGKLFHYLRFNLAYFIKLDARHAPNLGTGALPEFLALLRSQRTDEQKRELLPVKIFGPITATSDPNAFHQLAMSWYREGYSESCPMCSYCHCYMETSGLKEFGYRENGFSEQAAENILRSDTLDCF
jgi:hypothetical protein